MNPDQAPRNEKYPSLEESIELFSDYLKMEDAPEQADAIFILGGSTLGPTLKAAELYKAGYAPKIVFIANEGKFSGSRIWGMPEFQKYREVLREAGVPEEAMVSAGMSTNTLVEAKEAIPFMEKHGIDPNKVILISRPFHQRRAYATFKQQHPDVHYINCPADEPLDINDPETRERLVAEAERLLDYGTRKKDIEKQEIPFKLRQAVVIVRKHLKSEGKYTPRVKPPKVT